MGDNAASTFFGRKWGAKCAIFLLLMSGLGIRLCDLTDLPLDFNPTRQLFSAVKARGMYYQFASGVPDWQRQMAIEQWKAKADVEPPVIETMVAGMYLLFGLAEIYGDQLKAVYLYGSYARGWPFVFCG